MSLSVERMCALALDYLTPEEYEAILPPLRQGRAPAAMASSNLTCPQ
jgi:hypothetical protein